MQIYACVLLSKSIYFHFEHYLHVTKPTRIQNSIYIFVCLCKFRMLLNMIFLISGDYVILVYRNSTYTLSELKHNYIVPACCLAKLDHKKTIKFLRKQIAI